MDKLFRFLTATKQDPAVEAWFASRDNELGAIARHWFNVMRNSGTDVCELLHDGHPTACVGVAAFGYFNVFTEHLNVGFFRGSELADPTDILLGDGKHMRHVKLMPGLDVDAEALTNLIEAAYLDMKRRIYARE
jgi:hypothetical protein